MTKPNTRQIRRLGVVIGLLRAVTLV